MSKLGTMELLFFRAEYMMNVSIAEFAKRVIILVDGLMMSGGAGLAQACLYVGISEGTKLVMPEPAIGLSSNAKASVF